MTKQLRSLGGALAAFGVLSLIIYAIPPLRGVWDWFLTLPGPVQLGVGTIVVGFLLVLVSLFVERLEDRDHDRRLQED